VSFVLRTSDPVHCAHGGTLQATGSAKLTIGGKPVLLVSDVLAATLTGCVPPPNSTVCGKVLAVTGGATAKLTVGSQPVALDALAGTTSGLVGGVVQLLLPATAGQAELTAR
jgi:hypothetical protein